MRPLLTGGALPFSDSEAMPAATTLFSPSPSLLTPFSLERKKVQCSAESHAAAILVAGLLCVAPAMALPPPPTTPYSQSQNQTMQLGLLNGRIRSCPSDINPNCVSTSSRSGNFALPWRIPPESSKTASRKIFNAVVSTQKNPHIVQEEDTPTGHYLLAEVDGMYGKDFLEFLVKEDVVTYRSMAEKVIYVYPLTTPLGDFGAQDRRMKTLETELGWSVPEWEGEQ